MRRARQVLRVVGIVVLAVWLLVWVVFAVFVLHPAYVQEFERW